MTFLCPNSQSNRATKIFDKFGENLEDFVGFWCRTQGLRMPINSHMHVLAIVIFSSAKHEKTNLIGRISPWNSLESSPYVRIRTPFYKVPPGPKFFGTWFVRGASSLGRRKYFSGEKDTKLTEGYLIFSPLTSKLPEKTRKAPWGSLYGFLP